MCGLKVEAAHLAWTGGYSYFHRDVPLYAHLGPAASPRLFNHVITRAGCRGSGEVVASEGPLVLVRLPHGRCTPDPGLVLAPSVSQRFPTRTLSPCARRC